MLEENSSLEEPLRADLSTDEDERDNRPWYAIRLFTVRQKAVAEFFKENQFEVFIMEYILLSLKKPTEVRRLPPFSLVRLSITLVYRSC